MFLKLLPETIFPINLTFSKLDHIAVSVQIIRIPRGLPITVQYFAGFEVPGHNRSCGRWDVFVEVFLSLEVVDWGVR
jgi:hypothetical protein